MTDKLTQAVFDLEKAASEQNKPAFLQMLAIFTDAVIANEEGFAEWVVTPTNFENLKTLAQTHFNVPPKAMQLKARVPNRNKRAVFFLKAVINGVSRSI